jgi:hypothetical protein
VKPTVVVALVACLVAAPVLADSKTSHFSFKIPDGWTDKSSPETRAFYTVAFDPANHLSYQAKVSAGGAPVTPEFLDQYAGNAQKSVAKHLKGAELKVIDKKLVNIGGITAARFVFELPPPPDAEVTQNVRQLQFYVPAGDQHAVLTFSAPRDQFDKFAPLFERTAQATLVKR